MNGLPRTAAHGPPLEATNAVLIGLFKHYTDQRSMMPLPNELLPFVGHNNRRLADALYYLKYTDRAPPHGLTGQDIEQFMRSWTPYSDRRPAMDIRYAATLMTHGGTDGSIIGSTNSSSSSDLTLSPITMPDPGNPRPTLPPPGALLMTPMERVPADVPPLNGMPFALSAGRAPLFYTPSFPSESNTPGFVTSSGNPAGSTQDRYPSQQAPATEERGHRSFRSLFTQQSAPSDAGTVPHPEDLLEPELTLEWVTNHDLYDYALADSEKTLANGIYSEWNRLAIGIQMVVGHLDYGHVQPAGYGYLNLMEYIICNARNLGLLPRTMYMESDPDKDGRIVGRAVALRDVRNFWAQFYYFSRYIFTEQLLRSKAMKILLTQQEEAQLREAEAEARGGRVPAAERDETCQCRQCYRSLMGPNMWWSFGDELDQEWETYFKHFFHNQTLPEYLTPWFAEADVRFFAVELPEETPVDEADEDMDMEDDDKTDDDMEDDTDEKENDAPEEVFPNVMSYETVCRMGTCVNTLFLMLYPSDDKPTQGESDNYLPQMFFNKIRLRKF